MLFLKWEYTLWNEITGDFLSSYHSAPFRNWQELDGVAVISRLVSPPFPPGVQVLHTEVAPCGVHTAPHLIPALALISPASCAASRLATYLHTRKQTNMRLYTDALRQKTNNAHIKLYITVRLHKVGELFHWLISDYAAPYHNDIIVNKQRDSENQLIVRTVKNVSACVVYLDRQPVPLWTAPLSHAGWREREEAL